ncbi:hypothetical protein [Nocardia alni]|uniref:hypothetical protein n=1 Tax=Nocardia alni TaxID=2815723 RepID=UPI001C2343BB|nr:hypothetical protein [Nocardia alni]
MSYDHILLPSGVAATPAAVETYLSGQHGAPEAEAVAAIAAEVNRRNQALPEADSFLSIEVGGADTGAVLHVASPYDAIGHVRSLLFELATPRDYAVFDPQLSWLIDPAGRVEVLVTHGGAGEFPYLTRDLVDQWIPGLAEPGPYLIVEREPETYIQTYRNDLDDYTLEYRDGAADRHFGARVADSQQVADLIWDWAVGERARLGALDWTQVEL